MINKRELYNIGEDIKILVDVSDLGEGVKLDNVGYTLKFTSGSKNVSFTVTGTGSTRSLPSGLRRVNDHQVIAAFSTSTLDKGDLWLNIAVTVPDADFADGNRHQERDIDLMITLK